MIKYVKSLKKYEIALLIANAFILAGVICFCFTKANLFFNSDSSAANMLARCMTENGSLFPSGWVYSTSPMVWFLNIPIAFLSLFMSDQLLMRSISVLLFVVIAVVSIVFLSRRVLKNNAYLYIMPLMMCSISNDYNEMVFAQAAYLPSIFIICFSIAFFLDGVDEDFHITNKKSFVVFILLIIMFSFYSMNNLQQVVFPILGSIVINYLIKHPSVFEKKNLIKTIITVSLIIIVSLACIVSTKILSSKFIDTSNYLSEITNFNGVDGITGRIDMLVEALLYNMGIEGGVPLFTVDGVTNLVRIVFSAVVFVILPILSLAKFKKFSSAERFIVIFHFVSLAEVLIIGLFCAIPHYMSLARYLLPSMFSNFLVAGIFMHRFIGKTQVSRTVLVISICVSAVLLTLPKFTCLKDYKEEYSKKYAIIDTLEENDLQYGYASFWNAGIYTVASDFKLQINSVILEGHDVTPYYWLCDKKYYKEEYHSDKTFLLLQNDEYETYYGNNYMNLVYGVPVDVITTDAYTILVYDYNIAVNNFNGNPEKNIIPYMSCTDDEAMRLNDGSVSIAQGDILYGPYWNLDAGSYTVEIEVEKTDGCMLRITYDCGNGELKTQALTAGTNSIEFDLDQGYSSVEFVITNSGESPTIVKSVKCAFAD